MEKPKTPLASSKNWFTKRVAQWAIFIEQVRISWYSVWSNKLRTIITIIIIGLGITALVGILTAIDAIKIALNTGFSQMGANSFSIVNQSMNRTRGKRSRIRNSSEISYAQAQRFKAEFGATAQVGVSLEVSGIAVVKHSNKKTDPNVRVEGADLAYFKIASYEIDQGRIFSAMEESGAWNVAVLGKDVVSRIFAIGENPIGQAIYIGASKYMVVGILKQKGSFLGFNKDQVCVIPSASACNNFALSTPNYKISVMPANTQNLEHVVDEAEQRFRTIRKLAFKDEADFSIKKSDELAADLLSNLSFIIFGATIIGAITLFGAAIGLTNILLVNVAERTREIGTRKAIGANTQQIRTQFLLESIIISQLGGVVGIISGIIMGLAVASIMNVPLFIPWAWMLIGLVLCFITGIGAGLYPAQKAAKLSPIDALRYE